MTKLDKEPTHEEWATDFLNEAHHELNKAAIADLLTKDGNAARLLIGKAVTLVEGRPDKGAASWPDTAVEEVTKALRLLRFAAGTFDQARALDLPFTYCQDAVRMLENSGRITGIFENATRDNPIRFFVRPAGSDESRTADDSASRALATLRHLRPGANRQRGRPVRDRDIDRAR